MSGIHPDIVILDDGVQHRDGVCWYDAPVPWRWHKCRTQTAGWVGLTRYERCACGAVRRNGREWFDRNTRTGARK